MRKSTKSDAVIRTTVSIDAHIHAPAVKRMRALGIRKFSQYVSLLLEKDCREGGSLILIRPPGKLEKYEKTQASAQHLYGHPDSS
jgi:hypothetical protein